MRSTKDGIDEKQADVITSRISEAFGFLRDFVNDPSLAERIPDGSTLVCRSVLVGDNQFRLTAYRPEAAGEWSARVTSSSGGSIPNSPVPIDQIVKAGISADAALSALEVDLHALSMATNGLADHQGVRG